jgi:hypothetical protein
MTLNAFRLFSRTVFVIMIAQVPWASWADAPAAQALARDGSCPAGSSSSGN